MIASRVLARGLSEVTIAMSASSEAILPISGRFSRSRSPPQPKTQMTRPAVELARRRAARCPSAVGLVRVVDDHHERLPLVDRLEPARDAVDGLEPARDRLVLDPEQLRAPPSRRARSRR